MASPVSTVNRLEDFLLSDGPKQDCLVRICKYINVFDMVNVAESSQHSELFMEFFKERVVGCRSFEFTHKRRRFRSSVQTEESIKGVFQHFGPLFQIIKVNTYIISKMPQNWD